MKRINWDRVAMVAMAVAFIAVLVFLFVRSNRETDAFLKRYDQCLRQQGPGEIDYDQLHNCYISK